jgi:hypothetical protein
VQLPLSGSPLMKLRVKAQGSDLSHWGFLPLACDRTFTGRLRPVLLDA